MKKLMIAAVIGALSTTMLTVATDAAAQTAATATKPATKAVAENARSRTPPDQAQSQPGQGSEGRSGAGRLGKVVVQRRPGFRTEGRHEA